MAQELDFLAVNQTLTEGPFVLVQIEENYRVEVEQKGFKCTVLPDKSIKEMAKKEKIPLIGSKECITNVVNLLNQKTKDGTITCPKKYWHCPQYFK